MMRTPPSFSTALSVGSAMGTAATVPRLSAGAIAEKGSSTRCTVDESPPF
jgi:hypothetical protein